MKRLLVAIIVFSAGLMPLFAQTADSAGRNNTLDRVFVLMTTTAGRERLMQAMTGIPVEKLRSAENIRTSYDTQIQQYQAEINIRKAELTRTLLDTHPDMKQVEKTLHQALDWEYRLRLAEIQRDVKVRNELGDRNWGSYRSARKLLDDLDRIRASEFANGRSGAAARANLVRSLTPRERELLGRLQRIDAQPNKGQ